VWRNRILLLPLFLWLLVPSSALQSQEASPDYLVDYLDSLDSAIAEWEALELEIEADDSTSYTLSKQRFLRIVNDLVDSKQNERSALLGEQRAIETAQSLQTTSEESFSALEEMHQIQMVSNIIGAVLTTAVIVLVVAR